MPLCWWRPGPAGSGRRIRCSRQPIRRWCPIREVATSVEFRVLGPLEVRTEGQPVAVPPGQLPQLLAVLLLHVGRVVTVDTLMDVLWDGEQPGSARKLIQVRMSQLRRLLADLPVELVGLRGGYRFEVEPRAVDLYRFRSLVRDADRQEPVAATGTLRRALELWHGPALPDLRATARGTRFAVPLDEEYLSAVEAYAQSALAAGLDHRLADDLTPVLAEHPLRERLRSLLMLALQRAGRQADAIATFEAGRRMLAEELGLDPGSELRAAHAAVLAGGTGVPAASARADPIPARPAQLPMDLAGFTGRADELAQLDRLLGGTGGQSTALITAVAGTAGVGKTALAVHWAHRNITRFPDGQLYVNLRGFDPDRPPMGADEAVRGFLEALGVPPRSLPAAFDARTALYRSLLAGRRMLILLDNARDAQQVRPLLPGAGPSVALATSRHQLSGLVVAEGARVVTLDPLTLDDARELLARRIGRAAVAADPVAVGDIIEGCARLPLALAIVAARAASAPQLHLPALAGHLRDAGGDLDVFDAGDASVDARAVFSWSYRALKEESARMFRLLGQHPGPDVSVAAAASMAGTGWQRAHALLTDLARANLVTEHRPERFRCHDLLHSYAAELTGRDDTAEERAASAYRLFDHYLHTAYRGDRLLRPHRDAFALPAPVPGVVVTELGTIDEALTWFTGEHAVLAAVIGYAATLRCDRHTWQLTVAVADFLQRHGHWDQITALQKRAAAAATASGDPVGQAHSSRILGDALCLLGQFDAAHEQYRQALELFAELGNLVAQAHVEMDLGVLSEQRDDGAAALVHTENALRCFQLAGHLAGQGNALNNIGWLLTRDGEHERALRYCRDALAMLRRAGDSYGEANAWDSLGYIYDHLGRHADAVSGYRHALVTFEATGDTYYVADTLTHLGSALRHTGDLDGARTTWRRALDILDGLHHPDSDQVRELLDSLDPADGATEPAAAGSARGIETARIIR